MIFQLHWLRNSPKVRTPPSRTRLLVPIQFNRHFAFEVGDGFIAPRKRKNLNNAMSTWAGRKKKFQHKFRGRLDRLRRFFRLRRGPVQTDSTPRATQESIVPEEGAARQPNHGSVLLRTSSSGVDAGSPVNEVDDAIAGICIETGVISSDLWSAAYREAVDNLGKDFNPAVLSGDNILKLFKQLEKLDEDTMQESVFLRGVRYLRSIQVPLECFRLALDVATPLASTQPPVGMAVGIVKSVTAVSALTLRKEFSPLKSARVVAFEALTSPIQIAISISTADIEFAKRIGEMLDHLSYIDDCDTLGQRSNKADIHKVFAFVSVENMIMSKS